MNVERYRIFSHFAFELKSFRKIEDEDCVIA